MIVAPAPLDVTAGEVSSNFASATPAQLEAALAAYLATGETVDDVNAYLECPVGDGSRLPGVVFYDREGWASAIWRDARGFYFEGGGNNDDCGPYAEQRMAELAFCRHWAVETIEGQGIFANDRARAV